MRDRILHYLHEVGRAVPAAEILQAILNIRSPNAFAADRVLRGILGGDDRFCYSGGLWQARKLHGNTPENTDDFGGASFVFLERGGKSRYWTCLRGALFQSRTGVVWEFSLSTSAPMPEVHSLRRLCEDSGNSLLVTWRKSECGLWNHLLLSWGLEPWKGIAVSLLELSTRVLGTPSSKMCPERMAAVLALAAPDADQPGRMARFMAACFSALLEKVPEDRRGNLSALMSWIGEGRATTDFARFAFDRNYLRQLPATPGVYLMRNRAGDIIYVGKSRNLKRRVSSYFSIRHHGDVKVIRIFEQLHSLEVIPTGSEVEALLLEMRMIRDFRPPINLQAEIHEQSGAYGKDQDLILAVAEPGTEKVQLYFLREGNFAGQHCARLGRPAPSTLRKKIQSVYFGKRPRVTRSREPWEREIVYRWLSTNRMKLNFVDVNDAGRYEGVIRQLDAYLCDPDKLVRKVLYK